MEKENMKLSEQRKIDTEDIAVAAKKLSREDKERIYFIIKGMQISRGIEEMKEVKKSIGA